MKSLIRNFILTALCFIPCIVCAENTPMPYFCSFEKATDSLDWQMKTYIPGIGQAKNTWAIGNASHRIGKRGLYVTNDNGTSATYSETGNGYAIVAYKKFTLDAGTYDLTFDSRIGGGSLDVNKGKDELMVAWIPATSTPNMMMTGKFPNIATSNMIMFDGKKTIFTKGWSTSRSIVSADASQKEYYLAFYWKTNGGSYVLNPGACIDNIQLAPKTEPSKCHHEVSDIKTEKQDSGLNITWKGKANSYEIMYFDASNSQNTDYTIVNNLSTNSYFIPYDAIPAGVYSFRVRSICGNDTSIWTGISDVLLFDPSIYCFDFTDLKGPNVRVTKGGFANPYADYTVEDYGYLSEKSVHTVHYSPDQYDKYTGYQLKTVPDGSLASVRLCNWQGGANSFANSGSITYNYEVTNDVGVLLLNYAAVLQYSEVHPPKDQTRIHVEILDYKTDTLLSKCTEADFNSAEVSSGNIGFWNKYTLPADLITAECPSILWSDWRTIGINIRDYVGKKIKIRITLYACVANYHFAYAYFTLGCNDGKISGTSCGEKADTFAVSEGFNYRWYKELDPETTLSTERKFPVPSNDYDTYCVDMMNTEDADCYFTLRASALPRYPVAEADIKVVVKDGKNQVLIDNNSKVVTINDGTESATTEKCDNYEWDFGDYGTSLDSTPQPLIIPDAGDTFAITLKASMMGDCDSTVTYTVKVPKIEKRSSHISSTICLGDSLFLNGKSYSSEGEYQDTIPLNDETGLDSIVYISLHVQTLDTISTFDTICSNKTLDFFGKELNTEGIYEHIVKSSINCDSLLHIKTLTVNEALEIDFSIDSFEICADMPSQAIPYNVINGTPSAYQITYDSMALAAGFENSEIITITNDDTVKILLPQGVNYVTPNRYHAKVTFFNRDCGDVVFPISFEVQYSSEVLAQRWNDVLALRNVDYNGGYEFSSYQWYKGNEALEGETRPILYLPESMDFNASYRLKLKRINEDTEIFTCYISPVKFSDEYANAIPKVVFNENKLNITATKVARLKVYSATGSIVGIYEINAGENTINESLENGIYILNFIYEDGRVASDKIVVNKGE